MNIYQSGKLKRKDWLVSSLEIPAKFLAETILGKIEYWRIENLNDIKNNAFVLLPNHKYYWDVILEGILTKENLNRNAYYIMKSGLSPRCFLQAIGGISVTQMKEIIKLPKEKRKEALKSANELYDVVVPEALSQGEIIIIHPEGTRNKGGPIVPQRTTLNNLLYSQAVLGKQIPFVPLKISYFKEPEKRIVLNVAAPIKTTNLETLANYWLTHITQ